MKNRIAISALAAAVLILTACGKKAETVLPTDRAEQTQQTQQIQITETDMHPSSERTYAGVYWRTWSEEIGGTVVDLNSYIVLNADNTGFWIAQDVGTLTWNESQLVLTVGAPFKIALTQEKEAVNLLVYEFQDDNVAWIPMVYEKIEQLPAEMEKMLP